MGVFKWTDDMKSAAMKDAAKVVEQARRIVELETALRDAADAVERAYGGLPPDRYPGPPVTIVENMRLALRRR